MLKVVRYPLQDQEPEQLRKSIGRRGSRRAAKRPALSLESSEKCCDEEKIVTEHFEIRSCNCRCRLCKDCGPVMGYQLRRELIPRLGRWASTMLITVTVDQSLFANPEGAYRYVRDNRLVGRLVRELRKRKLIAEHGEYFAVVEFHKKGGWPHWHILVDARFIDHGTVGAVWDRFRPGGVARVEGRPGFGFVFLRSRGFGSSEHAANYASKYLVKGPGGDWPEWVLDYDGRIALYSASRGFWGRKPKRVEAPVCVAVPHPDTCFCEVCCGAGEGDRKASRHDRKTVRERLRGCGVGSILVVVRETVGVGGGKCKRWVRYWGRSDRSVGELGRRIGREPERHRIRLVNSEAARVMDAFMYEGSFRH